MFHCLITVHKGKFLYRGLVQRVIETGMTKGSVRVEEMTPLQEELDSSEDSEEESCAV